MRFTRKLFRRKFGGIAAANVVEYYLFDLYNERSDLKLFTPSRPAEANWRPEIGDRRPRTLT